MAGLLAWAADVVGAGSEPDSPAAVLQFSPAQLEEIDRLDKRASELQQNLQQLRELLPPPHIAQRLPHLHADSLASQSALALELHAHSATRIQAQIRESSLQSENAAYAKASSATEQQASERARESQQLQISLQELDQLEQNLKEECDRLESTLGNGEHNLEFAEKEDVHCFDDIALEEADKLELLKQELEKWQTKVAETRKELSLVEKTSMGWPSSAAQREKELERRLRALAEQLAAKQAQAERLIIERDALELRVEHASEARRDPWAESVASTIKRNKIGLKPGSSNGLSSAEQQRKIRNASSRDSLNLDTQLRSSMAFRAAIVAYVFGLHVVVLVVLSYSGMSTLKR